MDQPDELMIRRRLAGAQCDGIGRTTRRIGRFFADPVSGRWSWLMPSTTSSVPGRVGDSQLESHQSTTFPRRPRCRRSRVRAGETHIGPFNGSHRIHAGDATRSILVLGDMPFRRW